MNNKDRIINHLNKGNTEYLEVAEETRKYHYIDFTYTTFRDLFEELDTEYVLKLIDNEFGAYYQFSLDEDYIETENGDLWKLEDDFYKFDYLELKEELDKVSEEILEHVVKALKI